MRWSSSKFEAIRALQSNWEALVIDLTAIAEDKSEFRYDARIKAEELSSYLEDKSFTYLLHEYTDFLYLFKQVSEAFQGSEGLLIAKAGVVQNVIDKLQGLKTTPGKYVDSFLKDCSCSNGPCTVDTYFSSQNVKFSGIDLQDKNHNFSFPLLRPRLYDALIDGIKSYFNLDLLKSLEVFDPSSFYQNPSAPDIGQSSGGYCTAVQTTEEDWNSICTFLFDSNPAPKKKATQAVLDRLQNDRQRKESCVNALGDWRALKTGILKSEHLRSNFHETPAAFWFLALRDNALRWTPMLRTILKQILVTPFGSSDCERGSNVFSHAVCKVT